MSPKISVLMAVHSGEKYLSEAIDSILQQTFTDFEFIIVDDGSLDTSVDIIKSYRDSRIRLLSNEHNVGLTISLNKGLDEAVGKYIARMDCDDISLPERLARQVAFMDQYPGVGACGTWAMEIDKTGKRIGERQRMVGERLKAYYWIPSPIIHPSALIRSDILKRLRYDPSMRFAQDFDLWLRIVSLGYDLSNLPEYLFLYRVHPESISDSRLEDQLQSSYQSFCRHIAPLRVSSDIFFAFFEGAHRLGPLLHTRILLNLAKATHRPRQLYVADCLRYTKRWLQDYAYRLISTSQSLNPIRRVRRQIKSILP